MLILFQAVPILPSTFPKLGASLEVVNVDQINLLLPESPPNRIARSHGPLRLIPVPCHNALFVRNLDLLPQRLQLSVVEAELSDVTEAVGKVCRRNGRIELGQVTKLLGPQLRERCVIEGIAWDSVLDSRERCVSRTHHRNGGRRKCGAIIGREEGFLAQGFQGGQDGFPRLGAGGLEIDEKVQRLAARSIEDSVQRLGGCEFGAGVLAVERVEDGVDVERFKGALVGEGALFVANLFIRVRGVDYDATISRRMGGLTIPCPEWTNADVWGIHCNGMGDCLGKDLTIRMDLQKVFHLSTTHLLP